MKNLGNTPPQRRLKTRTQMIGNPPQEIGNPPPQKIKNRKVRPAESQQ
jgi:hypothetical protein